MGDVLKTRNLLACAWLLFSTHADARTPFSLRKNANHAFCKQDLSQVPILRGGDSFHLPENFEEHGLRPGLLHIQDAICSCLPRRQQHHPAEVRAWLHISPNQGEMTVKYKISPPPSPPITRMETCLGQPTVPVEPMPYVTDMVTADGPIDEVLVYPVLIGL